MQNKMSLTWHGSYPPEQGPLRITEWVRVVRRGGLVLALLCLCFILFLIVRVPEWVLFGHKRPVTPWISQGFCRMACFIIGLRFRRWGIVYQGRGVFVANHVGWLDILVLNACARFYFVAKSEVRQWGAIGWLARSTGTLFIARTRAQARHQIAGLSKRLQMNHKMLFFPEGTSTDGHRVLPFHSALFAAILSKDLPQPQYVQPISIVYTAPQGADPRFYGWWGNMALSVGVLKVLAAQHQGTVNVVFHPPLAVTEYSDRKTLAIAAETHVRREVVWRLGSTAIK